MTVKSALSARIEFYSIDYSGLVLSRVARLVLNAILVKIGVIS